MSSALTRKAVQDSLLRCEASAQYEREAGWLGTLISWRQLVAQRGLFLAYLSRMAKVLKLLKCINREISPRCERVIKRLFIFEKYHLNSRGETPAGCRICSIRCSFLPNFGRSATPAAGLAWGHAPAVSPGFLFSGSGGTRTPTPSQLASVAASAFA